MEPQIVTCSTEKLECENSSKRIRLQNESADEKCEAERRLQMEPQCDNTINNIIPREVLVEILSYLSRKELLLSAALVCKYWKTRAEDSQLWRRLDLKSVKDITTEKVKQLLALSKGIVHIDLQGCRRIDDSVISEISKQRRLRTLTLNECHQLSGKIFQSVASCRLLQQLDLDLVNNLTDNSLILIAESCTNLTALNIIECVEVTSIGLSAVIHHCKSMKSWKIESCKKVTDDFLIELAAKSPQTEILNISDCEFTANGLRHVGKLSKLTELFAASLDNMCDNLVSILSNLKLLDLEHCWNITNDGISSIVKNNPKLERLAVSSYDIDDTALEMISKSSCRSTLLALVIDHCEVTESGICYVLRSCPKLHWLHLANKRTETVKRLQSQFQNIHICCDYH